MDSNQPDATQRENAYRAIRRATAAIEVVRPGALETAAFLLSEAKANWEHTRADSTNLESKATALLGIVAAASGVLGVFGTRDGKIIVATPLATAAMACVIVALICMLYMLRAKRFDGVDIGPFISGAMVRDDHRIGLTLLVAETVYDMQVQLRREIEYDSRVLFLAYVATGAAAIALLANAVTVYPSNPSFHAPANAGTPVPRAKT